MLKKLALAAFLLCNSGCITFSIAFIPSNKGITPEFTASWNNGHNSITFFAEETRPKNKK